MMWGQPYCGDCDPHVQRFGPPGQRSGCALEGWRGIQKSRGGAHSAYTLGCCGNIWNYGPPTDHSADSGVLQVETEALGEK